MASNLLYDYWTRTPSPLLLLQAPTCFPNLQNLPILAGYPPQVARNTTPASVLYKRIEHDLNTSGADALKYAWLIIEACNSKIEVAPVWVPIAVFHASLVVWSIIILDGETRSRGSLKVLAIFKMELEGMKWPSCPLETRFSTRACKRFAVDYFHSVLGHKMHL
jgi:hypothetical protein